MMGNKFNRTCFSAVLYNSAERWNWTSICKCSELLNVKAPPPSPPPNMYLFPRIQGPLLSWTLNWHKLEIVDAGKERLNLLHVQCHEQRPKVKPVYWCWKSNNMKSEIRALFEEIRKTNEFHQYHVTLDNTRSSSFALILLPSSTTSLVYVA